MADTGKPVPKAATAPAVPAKDSTNNSYENEVVGNKTDTPVVLQSAVASAEGYLKGLAQRGNVFYCLADSGSTTSIVSAQMIGFGDSFFGNASGYGNICGAGIFTTSYCSICGDSGPGRESVSFVM